MEGAARIALLQKEKGFQRAYALCKAEPGNDKDELLPLRSLECRPCPHPHRLGLWRVHERIRAVTSPRWLPFSRVLSYVMPYPCPWKATEISRGRTRI